MSVSGLRRVRRPRPTSAFTLIEVLVTVVVLSVGIVTVLRAFNGAVAALDASRTALVANRIIFERMDVVYDRLVESGDVDVSPSSGRVVLPEGVFLWEIVSGPLERFDETGLGEEGRQALHEVIVTVRRVGSADEYSVITYVRTSTDRG